MRGKVQVKYTLAYRSKFPPLASADSIPEGAVGKHWSARSQSVWIFKPAVPGANLLAVVQVVSVRISVAQ